MKTKLLIQVMLLMTLANSTVSAASDDSLEAYAELLADREKTSQVNVYPDAGLKALEGVGIKEPVDITSAVLPYDNRRVTWKDDRELITRLFNSLRGICGMPQREFHPSFFEEILELNLKDGRTLRYEFTETGHSRERGSKDLYISDMYYSKDLPSVFTDIRTKESTIIPDVQIGALKSVSIQGRVLDRPPVQLQLSSVQGHTLAAKASALVDWVDLAVMCKEITENDIWGIKAEYGYVRLVMDKPVTLAIKAQVIGKHGCFSLRDPGTDIEYAMISCDDVTIVGRSNTYVGQANCLTPQVVMHDSINGRYYLFSRLDRRERERQRVIKGLPGHPICDVEYYKKPDKVFREAIEIVRVCSKLMAQQNDADGASTSQD